VPRYALIWVDIAIEQYLALPTEQQQLVDTRVQQLLDNPAGPRTSHDPHTDLWTPTDSVGAGLIVCMFRADRPRLARLYLSKLPAGACLGAAKDSTGSFSRLPASRGPHQHLPPWPCEQGPVWSGQHCAGRDAQVLTDP